MRPQIWIMTAETKIIVASGPELAQAIAEHLADGWHLVGQSTLGAGEFELHFRREVES